jgi:hypothetical protein
MGSPLGWLLIAGAIAASFLIAWLARGLDDHDDWVRSRQDERGPEEVDR